MRWANFGLRLSFLANYKQKMVKKLLKLLLKGTKNEAQFLKVAGSYCPRSPVVLLRAIRLQGILRLRVLIPDQDYNRGSRAIRTRNLNPDKVIWLRVLIRIVIWFIRIIKGEGRGSVVSATTPAQRLLCCVLARGSQSQTC
jgi:hypothetical protein